MAANPNEKAPAQIGAEEEERILSTRIGGTTVREALEAAVATRHVLRDADGRLRLAKRRKLPRWFHKSGGFSLNCEFKLRFLYPYIYRKSAVPLGCRNCYKVKVISGTIRQLMAVKAIADELPFKSKSGQEVEEPRTQDRYGSYFYLPSLAEARKAHKTIRQKVDSSPELGASVKMIIKRGCTKYEWAHGPLDNYNFDPQLDKIEAYLSTRFDSTPEETGLAGRLGGTMTLINIVKIAYQIGDETYKDFTNGEELYPPFVTYDPEDPGADSPESGESKEQPA